MKTHFDVIVVGGGAVGMSAAWRLAEEGRQVLVLERGRLGGEASGAAAGMLGAQLEVDEPGPFYDLCLASRSRYPDFVAALEERTGIDVQLVHNGILQLALTPEQAAVLQERMAWQQLDGTRAEWVDGADLPAWEPAAARAIGALYLPDDGNLSAPLLTRALAAVVGRLCTVLEGAEVMAIRGGETQVQVQTVTDTFTADHAIIAVGAWAKILLRQAGVECGIYPVKGQLLAVRPPRGVGLTRTLVTEDVYLVPKRDGTIVVGATEEHGAGFNRDVTVDAVTALWSAALEAAPGLAGAILERTWVGLRPGTLHGTPWIGPVPGRPRLLLAAGHFRNGILLSPITAAMLAAAVAGETWPPLWRHFLPPAAVIDGEA
ncbi:MAG: glycine oxidase ThiO [Thermoflavifilum sp.]|nr:glycine oxidase ThiO [Thermoflavifilum sp.]MCL6513850.1 glycine oxidase ThiO [Alicyclobacillus sp.]